MNCGQLITRVRRQLPAATAESVTEDDIRLELNIAVDKCNVMTSIYRTYTDITLTANKQVYSLSQDIPSFLGIEKSGVWYYNTSSSWKYLFPKSRRWLDLYIRNWRDLAGGEPNWYWIYVDELGFYPKPSAAQVARVHHLKKSTPMDNNNNYPWFNLSTGSGVFEAFDDALVAYAVWALSSAVGKEANKSPEWANFIYQLRLAERLVKKSPDLMSDYDYYTRIDGQKS